MHSVSYVSLRKISQTSINKMTNNGAKKIGTHSGVFHCDEVVACNLLKRLPEYRDAEIIRLVCAFNYIFTILNYSLPSLRGWVALKFM